MINIIGESSAAVGDHAVYIGDLGGIFHAVNKADGKELARYDLTEDGSTETALVFGELYRNGADWKFRAVGQGFKGGLGPLAKNFGVNI